MIRPSLISSRRGSTPCSFAVKRLQRELGIGWFWSRVPELHRLFASCIMHGFGMLLVFWCLVMKACPVTAVAFICFYLTFSKRLILGGFGVYSQVESWWLNSISQPFTRAYSFQPPAPPALVGINIGPFQADGELWCMWFFSPSVEEPDMTGVTNRPWSTFKRVLDPEPPILLN